MPNNFEDENLNSGPQGPEPAPSDPQTSDMPSTMGELRDASPEEQQALEDFMSQVLKLIYAPKVRDTVVKMLKAGELSDGIARVAAMAVARVVTAAEKSGVQLQGDVVFEAVKQTVEELGELCRELGIKDFTQKPEELEGAYFKALDEIRMMMQQNGRGDQKTFRREFDMLKQMDDSGELEAMFRRLAERSRQPAKEQESDNAPRGLGAAAKYQEEDEEEGAM